MNALSRYPQILHELRANKEDLLKRFHNRALKDTIVRVAKDPLRKLKPNDRLVGAAKYCMDSGLRPDEIVEGIAAALKYDNPQDPAAVKIQADISSLGLDYVIENVMKLDRNSELAAMIKSKM